MPMRNRDMPAGAIDLPHWGRLHTGETKRERAARAAMQGVLSNPEYNQMDDSWVAWRSVSLADTLYDELEKGGSDD